MVVLTSQQAVDQALSVIQAAKAKLVALTPHKASLEDLFIREANVIRSAKEAPVA
jgi:ABC-2 type transport system ATP-binding protein